MQWGVEDEYVEWLVMKVVYSCGVLYLLYVWPETKIMFGTQDHVSSTVSSVSLVRGDSAGVKVRLDQMRKRRWALTRILEY